MDPDGFDALLRSLSQTPTRREALHVLASSALGALTLGTVPVAAKKRGKGKRKQGKGKKVTLCHDGQTIRVTKSVANVLLTFGDTRGPCATDLVPPGPSCSPPCPVGMRCVGTQCVVGQGTCPPGGSTCLDNSGGGACALQAEEIPGNCQCEISTEGETRCTDGFGPDVSTGCGECGSSAECERLFPDIAGVFCINASGAENDCCSPGTRGYCLVPCPTPPACASPEDCPTETLQLCEVRTCTNGRCGKAFAPAGTPSAPQFQNPGDCRVMTCDGHGHDTDEVDNDDIPTRTECTRDACQNGEPVHEPSGTTCSGGTCDGAGHCISP